MKVFGREIIHLSSVDSTNNFAATLISEQICQNGTAILADTQSYGKGQRGNSWQSESGKNLLISFVFKPDNLSVTRQHELTWKTSICIVKTLAKFNTVAQVKWPNDIFVYEKKIAGILIENQIMGDLISNSIIGVGLNLNQENFGLLNATSLFNEIKIEVSKELIFNELCDQMNCYFEKNTVNEIESIKNEYDSLLYQKNQFCHYEDQNGSFEGEIIGTKSNGFLLLKVGNETREYGLKEIRYCSK
jgi:BirA family biotin operon repressor/biotin-[acetyl-CoA-carboxylase] ligase